MRENCYGCTKRYPGCHDECEVYANFKKKLEKPNTEAEKDYQAYKSDRIAQYKKRK